MRLPLLPTLAVGLLAATASAQRLPAFQRRESATTFEQTVDTMIHRLRTGMPKPKNEIYPGKILVKLSTQRTAEIAKATRMRNRDLALSLTPASLRNATLTNRVYRTGWAVWEVGKSVDPRVAADVVGRDPDVIAAQPLNKIYPLITDPDDADWDVWERQSEGSEMVPLGDGIEFRRLWYLDDIGALDGWGFFPNQWYTAATKPRNAPLIAIIDTGCDMNHGDFAGAGGSSTDVPDGGQFQKSLSKQFSFGEIVPDGSPEDTLGHGTHVTGLALAAGNNGAFEGGGIVGTGYACRGMILRVFDDSGNGSDADAAAAIYYAADNGAAVVSLSLGTENFSLLFQEAATYAFQKGCIVVAAGNEDGGGGGDLGPIYPAACSGVIAVTANGPNGVHASDYYAGTGMYIDVAAPGGDPVIDIADPENPAAYYQYIYSTTMTTDNPILQNPNVVGYHLNYGYLVGTSMATPLVSGGLGMYVAKNNLGQNVGGGNVRAYRALQRSALSVYGAPKGSWETYQGYGCFLLNGLLVDYDTRNATAGGVEGMVRINGTPTGNIAVRAKKDGSTTSFSTTTRADGVYRFDQLPPGNFTVTAAAGATPKSKRAIVVAGSEAPGVDFWCGGYTGDETAAIVRKFQVANATATKVTLRQWAYDTETGIDKFTVKIGTSPGASNTLVETELTTESELTDVAVNLDLTKKYYVTGTYWNGNGTPTTATATIGTGKFVPMPMWDAQFVSGNVPTTLTAGQTFTATLVFKNTGTGTWDSAGRQRISLGSQNPVGNSTWGRSISPMSGSPVLSGQSATFVIAGKAPSTPGTYNFQWRPRVSSVAFGSSSTNVAITVN